ncbi:Nmad2 family putative nucleotide modification protein [Rodentibacter haemolyticus]|uniref:Nucleotide modification associated domain-containing protein n=1 Tax=Rodentibacter haemolyticus TaxID=2778911 RepID=A0ABX6UZE6_9PAST|nr:hypothetical protein [Rodentibacter haemolyticus]QPB42753.1 hypothetical protein IHV77_01080 [Rodentibacter haemolyticus]
MMSYVIPYDYGFAPNPYGGYLTLATCKPNIRKSACIGDIIAATGSCSGSYKDRLIYVGEISEIINIDKYFKDPRFEIKKPNNKNLLSISGDNIYYKERDIWRRIPSKFHDDSHIAHDLKSDNVLICKNFWYFGNKAPEIPKEFKEIIKKGPNHKNIKAVSTISEFMNWLISAYEQGIIGSPSSLDNSNSSKSKQHCYDVSNSC